MTRSRPLLSAIKISSQRGAALLLFFMMILLTGTVFFVSNISKDNTLIENEAKTAEALAKAKEALLSYAATYSDTDTGTSRAGLMGFLPCPEVSFNALLDEGWSSTNCLGKGMNSIGHLPWKALGLSPLKDASGSCLWYAVAGEYKNSPVLDPPAPPTASATARSDMLNEDSNGTFQLFNSNGNVIEGATADDRPVAIIIAPGKALPGQARVMAAGTQCGDDFDATHFMELFNLIDNTDINTAAVDDFITSDRSNNPQFNDRIITISKNEIFDAIQRQTQFSDRMRNTTQALAVCVANIALQNPGTTPGGGCDLNVCLAQCSTDRNNCRDQCDNCRDQCDIDRDVCRASGTPNNVCNQQRNDCRRACPARNTCRASCDSVLTSCESNCNSSCGGGGGGAVNDFRLPWPAELDLGGGADYRDSNVYIENAGANHIGRFPLDINTTIAATGNPGGDYSLESTACNAVVTDNGPVNLNTQALATNSVERRVWQNWKDHFFYAVAGDYDSSNTNTPAPATACGNCLSSNGGGSYAGMVIYSGSPTGNQIRTVPPIDIDAKQDISNYLEGSNATNYSTPFDMNGNGDFQTGTNNDVAYCINEDMSVIVCP